MIYILHGEDTLSSYNRLQSLLKDFSSFEKINLGEKSQKEEILNALTSQDLLNPNQVIILENLLSEKKIDFRLINSAAQAKQLIFWEKTKILPKKFEKITVKKIILEFKLQSNIFYFLDSISQNSKKCLKILNRLPIDERKNLLWHLTNRFFLLILAKMDYSKEQSSKVTGKPFQNWQWDKVLNQSKSINLAELRHLFSGSLQIEYLKKSGKTAASETTLISTLFIKYLGIQ